MKNIILCILAALFLILAFYNGMSRELCRRNLSPAEYQEMQLDCKALYYR